MNTLKITLKQHTPLIHFQHDQDGATLRASEVKPKLDKFLRMVLNGDSEIISEVLSFCKKKDPKVNLEDIRTAVFIIFNRMKKEKAWMNNTNKSFYYKMKMIVNEEDYISVSIPVQYQNLKYKAIFPFVLANLDGKEKRTDLINFSFYSKIEVFFIAEDQMLLNKIDKYWDAFLSITNFGNRQDKGFGSFFREGKCVDDFKNALFSIYHNTVYQKNINLKMVYSYDAFLKMFKTLEMDYKKLKSGVGESHSLLKQYFENNGIYDWEKTAIKAQINKSSYIPDNCYYLRVLLGMTECMAYKNKNCTVKIVHKPETLSEEDKIERFQSPLMFKIFENKAFVIFENNTRDIIEQNFEFIILNDETKEKITSFELESIPEKFDIDHFLGISLKKLNWSVVNKIK